jgi:predicted PhzF superfamily epimerase YddE/YHI9
MTNGWAGFHKELQTNPISIIYNFDKRTGILFMEPGTCCDMSGCIAFFERIDPHVQRIYTIAGEIPSICGHATLATGVTNAELVAVLPSLTAQAANGDPDAPFYLEKTQ